MGHEFFHSFVDTFAGARASQNFASQQAATTRPKRVARIATIAQTNKHSVLIHTQPSTASPLVHSTQNSRFT
jgi:hypothetical protein